MGIFGKSPDVKSNESGLPKTPSAGLPAPPAARPSRCVIGAKTVVKGEIAGEEDIVVEGTVEGQVRIARDLHVALGGTVKANVAALSVVVAGELIGDCLASQRVEIASTGRLTGNIRAPKIVIAEGAVFKGNSDMSSRKEERKEHTAAS